ncbi:hypothetical protein I4U23_005063 [Adineta vaga]|nr:hypothetical protein I4U23_005063 [Adineta vaga]
MMRFLCKLIVLTLIFEAAYGARHQLRHFDDDDDDETRNLMRSILQQRFLRKFQLGDDEENDFNNRFYSDKRADTASKKCTSVDSGMYYDGASTRSIHNIEKYEDCMDQCEKDDNCYGWAYQSSSKTCTVQNSISWKITDASYVAGSCLGPAAKQKVCEEKLSNTIYNGNSGEYFRVNTAEDCMKKCDSSPKCLGYIFSSAQKACWSQTAQYGSGAYSGWTSGSCVIPKSAYPPISIEEYRQQALKQHNIYRSKHCTPPLKLNASLNDIAQKYAEKLAKEQIFQHSNNKFNGQWMGENLYMSGGGKLLYTEGSLPVTAWYNEIKDYNWNNPGFSMSTGHFTQVIWKGSTELGIGRAVSNDGSRLYVVGNYFPGGNVGGSFPNNVKQALC